MSKDKTRCQVFFYGLYELERVPVSVGIARSTETIRNVVIYGLHELDSPGTPGHHPDQTLLLQGVKDAVNVAAAAHSRSGTDLLEIWRHAMVREMGMEEFEKYCFSTCKRHRHGRTKPPYKP